MVRKSGDGILLAGQRKPGRGMKRSVEAANLLQSAGLHKEAKMVMAGSGLVIAGSRGRGRPRKSDLEGGSFASIFNKLLTKQIKKSTSSPKEFFKTLEGVPKFIGDKKTWTNAKDFLNDKSVKETRTKFDKVIVKLLDKIPAIGSTLSSKYTSEVINQPTKGDIKGAIERGIKTNQLVKTALKQKYGIELPKTPTDYLLDGDLDGMVKSIEEMKKFEPRINELIAKIEKDERDKANLENKDNLWVDNSGKTLYADEAKKAKEEYLKANPQPDVPVEGAGIKLAGSRGGRVNKRIEMINARMGKGSCGCGVALAGSRGRGVALAGARGKGKPANKWVQHVKEYAAKHNMKYNEAIRASRDSYRP